MSQKPAHKITMGNLRATIWRNSNPDKGTTWYSVTPSRGYKGDDDVWRDTDSLGFDDLLGMAKLLDQAHTWIANQMKADARERRDREGAGQLAA